jgi:hypothetical protein
MDWDTYQTIMDKVMEYTPNFCVVFSGFGEPLLNPYIYDFVKYVSQKGRTSIITNAAALTPTNVQRLSEAGLAQLTVSFNGTEKTLYELMMGGLEFERAQKHLESAVALTNGTQTVISANVSVTEQTKDHLLTIKNDLERAGIEQIYFSKCHNRGGTLQGDNICTTPIPLLEGHHCQIFTDIMFVTWTGQVLPCYHDMTGMNVIGDLRVEPIEAILCRKKEIAAASKVFSICHGCNDLYQFAHTQTPDGRPLSDWVFDLYTDRETRISEEVVALSKWLFAMYMQEGSSDRFFEALTRHIECQNQEIEALNTKIQTLQLKDKALMAVRENRIGRSAAGVRKICSSLFSKKGSE